MVLQLSLLWRRVRERLEGRKKEKEKAEEIVLLAGSQKAGREKGEENRGMEEGEWMNLGKIKLHRTVAEGKKKMSEFG